MVTSRRSKPEIYVVRSAVNALKRFCKNHGEEVDEYIINFAIAWRESDSFEWTPCSKDFRRIITLNPEYSSDGKVAVVFDYSGVSRELTDELNKLIREYTRNCWLE